MKIFYQSLLIGTFLPVFLIACSDTTSNQSAETQATTQSTTTTDTPSKGGVKVAGNFVSKLPDTAPTYKVITTGSMAPFSFINEKGELMGLDIDAVRAIGEAGGFKVEFYTHPWQGMFDTVNSGQYDMASSGISYTDERAQIYGLSNSYFFNPSAIMVKQGVANMKGLADIKDLRIAGMTDSKQLTQAKNVGATQIKGYTTTFLAFKGLVQGHEDTVVQDEPFLRYTAKQHPNQKVTIVPYEDANEPSAQQIILMKKGNQTLINSVNKGIETIKNNGEMAKIEEKWLGKKA